MCGTAAALLTLAVAACRNEPRASAVTGHGTFVVQSRTLVRGERFGRGGCSYRTPGDTFYLNTPRRPAGGRLSPLIPWLCVALYERGEFRGRQPRDPVDRNDYFVTETFTLTNPAPTAAPDTARSSPRRR